MAAASSAGNGRTASTRIGKYDVEGEIGGGTSVRVFHGWDRATGRRVTLKVLTDVAETLRAERFRREVAAVANLRSPNLISIYELGEHVGMPFVAAEYLGEEHLGRAIAGARTFSALEKMRVMWQVAEGVRAAHRGGLAYVGLRPSGIALGADGSAKIQDFGIVRLAAAHSGELRYEDEADSADGLSDVFAYGVIYYELLSGVHPLAESGTSRIVSLREIAPECPEPLEQLIVRAMEPDRELRYQTLDDIQYDAEPILRQLQRQRAEVLIEGARRRMEERELDAAQAAVREALDLDPGNVAGEGVRAELRGLLQQRTVRSRVDALLHEAEKEAAGRRFERAAELLESASRLDAGHAGVAALLQSVRARLEQARKTAQLLDGVREALNGNDLSAAEARVLEALDADPEHAEALELADAVAEAIRQREMEGRIEQGIAKAKSLLLAESFDAALETLAALEAECPGSAAVNQWRTHIQQQKDQRERSGRLDAELNQARALMAREQFAEAAEILEQVRIEFPQEQGVATLLAECCEAAERAATVAQARRECELSCREARFENAIAILDAAGRAYPDDPNLAELRLEVEERRREREEAAAVRQALEEAQWLLDQDRVDMAVQFLREKSAAQPKQAELAARLAEAEKLQSEWEGRRLVQDCLHRAAVLEQAHQWAVALTVVEEALETCPESTELQEAVERLRARQRGQELQKKLARWTAEARQALADGEIAQAEQVLRLALETLPGDPGLHQLRAELEAEKKFGEEWHNAQVLVGRRQFEEAERILVRLNSSQRPEVQTLLTTVRESRAASEEEGFYKRGREKALLLIQQNQTEQAADLLRNLLSLFPGDPILQRDLQAIGGTAPAAKAAKAEPVFAPLEMPAVKSAAKGEEIAPRRSRPDAPPQSRRWVMIAGTALVLVSAGGVTRMLRSGSAAPAPAKVAKAAVRAALAAPAPVAETPSTPTPQKAMIAEPPKPVAAPAREPIAAEPKQAPAPVRRHFNTAALTAPVPTNTPAALAPAPPIAGTTVNWVEPLPATVTPALRAPAPPVREAPPAAAPAPRPRIGGELQQVKAISLPPPEMPMLAKERRIDGVVSLEATIDKQGAVSNVKVISGNSLLVQAAVDGVKKWRYQPAMLNGQPIEAEIKIEVRFTSGR
ncbi:MAG TPA: TonB family protein [Bryobacteraceae bacterium]|nr:TonB family protein [Bryobacteraceae bacterium]